VVTVAEVEQYLALGHEVRSFEVKGPGSLSDKAFCARVARATMAMGNLRDGGLVCLGIDDKRMSEMLPGLGVAEMTEWCDFDDVSDAVARYSEPPVAFSLHPFKLSSGAEVVVIEVAEFEDVPHVCRRDYPGVLQKGMTYVRPRGKPESVPVPSAGDMRELLDLAITKGVREFIRRAGAAGVGLPGVRTAEELDSAAFRGEMDRAWSDPSPVLDRILDSGYLDVAIRPTPYVPDRVSPAQLESLLAENTVRLRGWPVPYVDYRVPLMRHGSWIGQDIEPQVVPHSEAWRFCTSGQFLHRRILASDLRSSAELAADDPTASGSVVVWDVLLYLVEVAELAARFATAMGCESVTIAASLNGIAGRQLVSGDWKRDIPGRYIVNAPRLETTNIVDAGTLIRDTRRIGVQITQGLLSQFGLDVPDQVLLSWQDEVFSRA
jgi:hypothetical protein